MSHHCGPTCCFFLGVFPSQYCLSLWLLRALGMEADLLPRCVPPTSGSRDGSHTSSPGSKSGRLHGWPHLSPLKALEKCQWSFPTDAFSYGQRCGDTTVPWPILSHAGEGMDTPVCMHQPAGSPHPALPVLHAGGSV